ncbi:MAG TPA: hypothetical protein VEY06_01800 [Flavisolibacter sp.]|jgi:hypothetical protein|nr:hypothetical protein [Flavisolibacter sp.]
MKLLLFLFIALISLSSLRCQRNKGSELERLPAITQTGAGTFGCLINGKAYTSRGHSGNNPNFYIIADPEYFGNLDIRTYHYENGKKESLKMFCYDVTPSPQTYSVNNASRIWLTYDNENNGCVFLQDSANYVSGYLKITRYDLQNGIIAGEFECKFFDAATSCDTIKITNGRFDYKL